MKLEGASSLAIDFSTPQPLPRISKLKNPAKGIGLTTQGAFSKTVFASASDWITRLLVTTTLVGDQTFGSAQPLSLPSIYSLGDTSERAGFTASIQITFKEAALVASSPNYSDLNRIQLLQTADNVSQKSLPSNKSSTSPSWSTFSIDRSLAAIQLPIDQNLTNFSGISSDRNAESTPPPLQICPCWFSIEPF